MEDNPQHLLEHLDKEISFPIEKRYDSETKTVVARLHRNFETPTQG